MSDDFSPTMALEISGYFTQNVPPKPQQTSGDFISLQAEALHRAEQLARLLLDAELAQARAGIVIGDDAVVARRDLGDAQHVDQERHQLVAAAGQVLGPRLHRRIVVEQAGIVMAQHAAARARGRDHGVVAFEGLDDLGRDRPRRGAVAGIVGRLAAADLQGRDLDRAAGVLEELYGGETDRGPEQVDQAGDEERDAARRDLIFRGAILDTTATLAAAKMRCNGRFLEKFQADITVATKEDK